LNAEHKKINGEEPFGVTIFSDMCPNEFKSRHNMIIPANRKANPQFPLFSDEEVKRLTVDPVDWRTKGAVTAVKDQGQCGSCWAFSSTGNMEGQWQIAGNSLTSLSEEELVQCSHNGNQGCNGGLMDDAFHWVITNGGIDSESDYPYTSGGGNTGSCNSAKMKNVVAKFASVNDVAHVEAQMATFVASKGPLAIAVDAASGWQNYKSGIMSNCHGRQLDHGVLAVGYGVDTSGNISYWIVKNSWSASWGEQGYIRLAYGSNQCGLNMMPSSIVA
jgi:C1A family cysteine protease